MKIGLIGCGKVGTSVFYYLRKNNAIVGVDDINKKHEKRTAKLLGIKKNPELETLCWKSKALFFATPDDEIIHAYRRVRRFIKGRKYVFHFSGLQQATIFPKTQDVYRASVHPFATFPQLFIPPVRKHYFMFVEGDTPARRSIRRIFGKKHFTITHLHASKKAYYHLLGVFSSNFIVGLTAAMHKLAKKTGWTQDQMRAFIFPMIDETIENIKLYGIEGALSGPLTRGDTKTIRGHVRTLKKNKSLTALYKAMSLHILETLVKEKRRDIAKILTRGGY
jgi:predicted short-subunit dehydrogenase-like oxidoreductase (DUF2520 family)